MYYTAYIKHFAASCRKTRIICSIALAFYHKTLNIAHLY